MTLLPGEYSRCAAISAHAQHAGRSARPRSSSPTRRLFSTFFRLGQTLETFRGQGIYQESVNTATLRLNEGAWVHLFSEGKVNQPDSYILDSEGNAHLPRFKWGVGRMLMESLHPPIVIPIWLTGYENLMPQGRRFPQKYLPHLRTRMSVTFGDPIPVADLQKAMQPLSLTDPRPTADVQRSRITQVVHNHVEDLGRTVCGKLLTVKQDSR